jgi:hypothetical protein
MRTFLARLRAGRLRLTAAVVVGVLALALSGTALAVHDETFELDGNLNKADSAARAMSTGTTISSA